MIVRVATPADAATLAALGLRTFLDTFAALNRAEDVEAYVATTYGEALQRREIENPNVVTLVVELDAGATPTSASHPPAQVPRYARDDEMVAFAQIRRTPRARHGDVEIARFYVDQSHHGRGIAQALMDAVYAHARALGGTRLWLGVWEHNFRAIAFYAKCGFERVGEHPFLLGTDLQTDWEMAREL